MSSQSRKVVAVIGAGGMGLSAARRIARGRLLLLASYSPDKLEAAAQSLRNEGHDVQTHAIDVSDHASTVAFAKAAAAAGQIEVVVHTGGVSPVQASDQRILDVDLVGTANVIDAFYAVAVPGMTMVCIASMAAYLGGPLPADLETHLATAPLGRLLDHPLVDASSQTAYALAKRGNILRVQAVAKAWWLKGARINTVSPGVISTSMGQAETKGESGAGARHLVEVSAAGRMGSAEDVTDLVEFLVGSRSSFISGNDFLVDGGTVAGQRWAAATAAAGV
jgi:NAD(P)-dependent dehydrogenase (short-subunit alcohol dehydrogenase family)